MKNPIIFRPDRREKLCGWKFSSRDIWVQIDFLLNLGTFSRLASVLLGRK